jgi:hypothetical protein
MQRGAGRACKRGAAFSRLHWNVLSIIGLAELQSVVLQEICSTGEPCDPTAQLRKNSPMSESTKPLKCPVCRSTSIEHNEEIHLHLGHGLHRVLHHHPVGAVVGMAVGFLIDHQVHKAHKAWKCTSCSHKFSGGPDRCARCTAAFSDGTSHRLRCCSRNLCTSCKDEIVPYWVTHCDLCGSQIGPESRGSPAAAPESAPQSTSASLQTRLIQGVARELRDQKLARQIMLQLRR